MAEHTTVFITDTTPGVGTRTYTESGKKTSMDVNSLTANTEYIATAEYERPDGVTIQTVQGVTFRTLVAGKFAISNEQWVNNNDGLTSTVTFNFTSTYAISSIILQDNGVQGSPQYQCSISGNTGTATLPYYSPGTQHAMAFLMTDIYTETASIGRILTLQAAVVMTPLYFEAFDPGYNPWVALNVSGNPYELTMQISFDLNTWENYTFGDHIEFNSNRSRVYFRNSSTTRFSKNDYNDYFYFSSSNGDRDYLIVGGNISSLKDVTLADTTSLSNDFVKLFLNMNQLRHADDLYLGNYTTVGLRSYEYMFSGCTSLVLPPTLPATTIGNGGYSYMFYNCSSMTNCPDLPATQINAECYESMFRGCVSIVDSPAILPATQLDMECYNNMFYGCTQLVSAPLLPARNPAYHCYTGMFKGCILLDRVTCLLESLYGGSAATTADWLSGTSSTGAFYKSPNMSSWPTGDSGIPSGWTVIDYQN